MRTRKVARGTYNRKRLDGATDRTEHIHKGQYYRGIPILFGGQGDNQSPPISLEAVWLIPNPPK